MVQTPEEKRARRKARRLARLKKAGGKAPKKKVKKERKPKKERKKRKKRSKKLDTTDVVKIDREMVKIKNIHDGPINVNTTSITKKTVKLKPKEKYKFVIETNIDKTEIENLKRIGFIKIIKPKEE